MQWGANGVAWGPAGWLAAGFVSDREPVADEIAYRYGTQPLIDQCRMTFVVTEVQVVSPP